MCFNLVFYSYMYVINNITFMFHSYMHVINKLILTSYYGMQYEIDIVNLIFEF